MPVSGRGRAVFQPIWADDVAGCVVAALREDARDGSGVPAAGTDGDHERYELAGPETLSHTDIVRTLLRSLNRKRPLLHVSTPVVSRVLRIVERVGGSRAFATWDEAELMETTMTSARGAADAEALGVRPQRLAAVLGSA
jgi:NADH dehydrogenase